MPDRSQYPPPEEMERRRSKEPPEEIAPPPTPSGLVAWLAQRLKTPVSVLTARIDDDTLRRTKYPFQAHSNPDGTTTFKDVIKLPGSGRRSTPTSEGSRLDQFRGGVRIQKEE
jgi:hypothetical protein